MLKLLETEHSHTNNKFIKTKKIPLLKVIAYENIKILSHGVAHVDKLSEFNRGVKYLLATGDCWSLSLHPEQLKSKYATTAAAFKKD